MLTNAKKKIVIKLNCLAKTFLLYFSFLSCDNGKKGVFVQGGVGYECDVISSSQAFWQGDFDVFPNVLSIDF